MSTPRSLHGLSPRLQVAAAAVLFAFLAAVFAWRFADYAVDDFFITYRYADNLAHGRGLVFNPGERVFGTTAAGLALLLGGLDRVTGISLPRLGTAVTWLSLVALATLLFAETRAARRGAEGLAAGCLLITSTFVWLHNGSEIYPALALLAVAAVVARRAGPRHTGPRSDVAAGLLAGAVVWLRPDALLGGVALGAREWAVRRRLPWRYGVAAAALIACGLGLAWAYFGDPLPATLEAKRLQARWLPHVWPSGLAFWPAAAGHVRQYYLGTALLPAGLLALAGLPALLRRGGPALRTLTLYAALLVPAYPLLGVPLYPWYALPLLLVGLYAYCFACGAAARWLWHLVRSRLRRHEATEPGRLGTAAAATLALLLTAVLAAPLAGEAVPRSWRTARTGIYPIHTWNYRDAGLAIRRHTAPGRVVAALEVGTLAFYADRPVHDLLGLVSPSALPAVAAGDLTASFRAGDPDLFVYYTPHDRRLDPIREQPGFAAEYRELARFRVPRTEPVLIVYGRGDALAPDTDAPSPTP